MGRLRNIADNRLIFGNGREKHRPTAAELACRALVLEEIFATLGEDVVHIVLCPQQQLVDERKQTQSSLCQAVLYARRYLGVGLAYQETISLKRLERGCKHLLGDIGYGSL